MKGILLMPRNPISAEAKAKLDKLLSSQNKRMKQLVKDFRKGILKPK